MIRPNLFKFRMQIFVQFESIVQFAFELGAQAVPFISFTDVSLKDD